MAALAESLMDCALVGFAEVDIECGVALVAEQLVEALFLEEPLLALLIVDVALLALLVGDVALVRSWW